MKFLTSQISYFLNQGQSRQNIAALAKYLVFLVTVIVLHTVVFHLLMLYVEGREYSWLSGLYWTLVVMTTLGFGDITFESDIGRAFSVLVLLSGVVLLLIMLPFTFIRFFYAPWLEAQLHAQSPRQVPPDVTGHVIICGYDSIARELIKRLVQNDIPYFVIEPNPELAARYYRDDISVIHGEVDSRKTYERMRVKHARLIFANLEDTTNTNITLTIRETAPAVPIVAVALDLDSIDILELSGATHVLPLKHQLGEHLANRISVGKHRVHVVGNFDPWVVVEFTINNTKLQKKKISETGLRESTGVNIVGIWRRGRLMPAEPDHQLLEFDVPLGLGTREQITQLQNLLGREEPLPGTVLILGGGKVGRAAALALKREGHTVYMVEREPGRCDHIRDSLNRLTVGDANERDVLIRGGLMDASLVLLTTNDDAVNIYLSIYCRRLNPEVRIISRITHERNLEAIHRAGADFALGYDPLGAESVMALVQERPIMIMGEGVEAFTVTVPNSIAGRSLQASEIGRRTGLIVLSVAANGERDTNVTSDILLPAKGRLELLGTSEQMRKFNEIFRS